MPSSRQVLPTTDTTTSHDIDTSHSPSGPGAGPLSTQGDAAVLRILGDSGGASASHGAGGAGGAAGARPGGMAGILTSLFGADLTSIITGNITDAQFTSWGQSLANRAVTQIGTLMRSGTHGNALETAMANQAITALTGDLRTQATAFLASPQGQRLAQALSAHFDGSSQAAMTTILLAAAYLAVSDIDLPTLQHQLNLGGGVSLTGTADVGSIRHLALQSIGARLSFSGGGVTASVGYNHLSGAAARSELGGSGTTAHVTSRQIADSRTIEQLQANISWQVNQQITLRGSNTTDFSGGRLVRGSLSATVTDHFTENDSASLTVRDTYAGRNTGITGSMQFQAHIVGPINLTGSGNYNPTTGEYSVILGVSRQF